MIVVLLGVLALLWAGTVAAAPPGNDDINSATAISSLPFSDALDTTEATTAPDDPYCGGNVATVWYAITLTQNTVVKTDTAGSDYGANVSVYTGSPGALSYITCAFSQATFNATAGVSYYVMISSSFGGYPPPPGTGGGNLVLSVTELPPPANDNFADAVEITSLPSDQTVDITGATREAGEPTSSCDFSFPQTGTAWFRFTSGSTQTLSARDNTYYGYVAIYTGSSLNTLTQGACSYLSGTATFVANAGTTYYIQLGGWYGTTGPHTLHLEVTPPPVASFYYYPGDPSLYDSVNFCDNSYDPGFLGFQSVAWDFGDGATATGGQYSCQFHQYAADGDYTVSTVVTTVDGRTASTSQTVSVKTHDVAITKVNAPRTAKAGQTRTITVNIKNTRYEETVQVQLYKSVVGGFQFISLQTVVIPVRQGNRTTAVSFTYTFTSDDASLGKVSFQAIANIVGARDALSADNTAISTPPTTVNP